MASRRLNDWISRYLEYTDNTEPPTSYHTWSAISVIAACLQRRVWLTRGHRTIYPNEYIVLVGPSGRTRKGTAMNLAEDLISGLTMPRAGEAATKESLVQLMKNSVGTFVDPMGRGMRFQCPLHILSPELSVFLGNRDIKFLSWLTDWYDSKDRWVYQTKNMGTDEVAGVCVNILGGTAQDWMSSMIPQEAMGGGFTSRVIWVVEYDKKQAVADETLSKTELELKEKLAHDINVIYTLTGPMKMTKEADEWYKEWYLKEEELLKTSSHPVQDPRLSGYVERRPTHLLKISIIMSASRGNDLTITVKDLERTLTCLNAIEPKMGSVFTGVGQNPYALTTEKILEYITSLGTVSRSTLLRRFRHDVNAEAFENIERVLSDMKLIKVIEDPMNSERKYEYIGP